jgi:hypothetical protein
MAMARGGPGAASKNKNFKKYITFCFENLRT